MTCIEKAAGSSAALVNLLVESFEYFRDETKFDGKNVRFYKRAQIFVADLWACFEGEGSGSFGDIDKITMFAGKPACIVSLLAMLTFQITGYPRCYATLDAYSTVHL